MSYFTDVLIQGVRETEIAPLNEWLLEHDPERQQQFREISMEGAGGTKVYTSDVWAAAFNYMPFDLIGKLRDPATWGTAVLLVAVIIHGEEVSEAFVFDGDHEGGYRPVMRQECRQ